MAAQFPFRKVITVEKIKIKVIKHVVIVTDIGVIDPTQFWQQGLVCGHRLTIGPAAGRLDFDTGEPQPEAQRGYEVRGFLPRPILAQPFARRAVSTSQPRCKGRFASLEVKVWTDATSLLVTMVGSPTLEAKVATAPADDMGAARLSSRQHEALRAWLAFLHQPLAILANKTAVSQFFQSVLTRLVSQASKCVQHFAGTLRLPLLKCMAHVLLQQVITAPLPRAPDAALALAHHLHFDVLSEALPTDAMSVARNVMPAVVLCLRVSGLVGSPFFRRRGVANGAEGIGHSRICHRRHDVLQRKGDRGEINDKVEAVHHLF